MSRGTNDSPPIRPKRVEVRAEPDVCVYNVDSPEAEEEVEQDGEDGATPFARKTHRLPSLAEQKLHQLTHLPYRPWCPECVAGRKPNWGHKSVEHVRDETSVPEVHFDYCFFRNAPKGESVPVIVLKDRDSRAISAHVVPYKGGDLEWAVLQSIRDSQKWGIRGDLICRSDQEPALNDFINEIARVRGGKVRRQNFPREFTSQGVTVQWIY